MLSLAPTSLQGMVIDRMTPLIDAPRLLRRLSRHPFSLFGVSTPDETPGPPALWVPSPTANEGRCRSFKADRRRLDRDGAGRLGWYVRRRMMKAPGGYGCLVCRRGRSAKDRMPRGPPGSRRRVDVLVGVVRGRFLFSCKRPRGARATVSTSEVLPRDRQTLYPMVAVSWVL